MIDEFQKQFCQSWDENIRLLAPAGSGKTHSLLWRCRSVYTARKGAARFLVVTFTRAARDELRKRLASPDFAEVRSSVEVATLNGWGFRRVRQNHHMPRLQVSEADRSFCVQNALQPVWKRHPLVSQAIEAQPFPAGKVIMNLIDLLKSLGFVHRSSDDEIRAHLDHIRAIGLATIIERTFTDLKSLRLAVEQRFEEVFLQFAQFWRDACASMIDQSLFTLEDQKYVTFLDLQDQNRAGRKPIGGARYTHLLVDEFQDINPLDLALVKEIADLNSSHLTIVGDDDQAIFEWRGATFRYIVNPEEHLGRRFQTYILERNYRCPANIIDHSQKLIVVNKNRVPKRVVPVSQERARIEIVSEPTFDDVFDRVVSIVKEFRLSIQRGQRRAGARLALISRKRAQLIPYQILLASEGIEFCAAEDLQVFMSNAFENLTKVLSICDEAHSGGRPRHVIDDIVHMCNLAKRFPLKKKERQALDHYLRNARPRSYDDAVKALAEFQGPLKGANNDGIMSRSFAGSIANILRAETVQNAIEVLGHELTGLEKDYGKSNEDIFYTDPPFFYLAQFARRYGTDFPTFIEDIDNAARQLAQLPVDEDEQQRAADGNKENDVWSRSVHLMTALRAKGKEFDTVVMLDVNDGIWPSIHAETLEQKEQERRLFYVAMTRAKSRLIMTLSGRIGDKVAGSSPFIAEAGVA